MWLSPQRRAHSFQTLAKVVLVVMANVPESVFQNDRQDATVTLIRDVAGFRMVFGTLQGLQT
eukprot:9498024-Pyramimonas_sp.AAC.1